MTLPKHPRHHIINMQLTLLRGLKSHYLLHIRTYLPYTPQTIIIQTQKQNNTLLIILIWSRIAAIPYQTGLKCCQTSFLVGGS